jgi:hypothetical protein
MCKITLDKLVVSTLKKEFSGKWSVLAAAWGSQFVRGA